MLSAAQSHEFPGAVDQLKSFESTVAPAGESVQGYVAYRLIGADYAVRLASATNSEIRWRFRLIILKQLEVFVDRYPTS